MPEPHWLHVPGKARAVEIMAVVTSATVAFGSLAPQQRGDAGDVRRRHRGALVEGVGR